MAKQLKLKIKNIQLAKAAGLENEVKKSPTEPPKTEKKTKEKVQEKPLEKSKPLSTEETPLRRRAKSKSSFAPQDEEKEEIESKEENKTEVVSVVSEENDLQIVEEVIEPIVEEPLIELIPEEKIESHIIPPLVPTFSDIPIPKPLPSPPPSPSPSSSAYVQRERPTAPSPYVQREKPYHSSSFTQRERPAQSSQRERPFERNSYEKLGPTGKHVKDLYSSSKRPLTPEKPRQDRPPEKFPEKSFHSTKPAPSQATPSGGANEEDKHRKKVRDFKDIKQPRKEIRPFDARDRKGLTEGEDERWRKKRPVKGLKRTEEPTIRPTKLSVRMPISIKDLSSEMKLKASELIQKLFLQGMAYTVNDILNDETVILLLGSEFGCEISIDTKEEERIQITKKTIQEEINAADPSKLKLRPPVAVFMGHVDHGKTSLIDAIRKSNITKSEAGAITQHIGAFRCKTAVGDITILDTPGHSAFSAMRARGAEVTDIVILVVAGDEGIREQTMEAIQHAKAAHVTIVVAINKCDKPNFDPENVYRQLADADLLPEAWGGHVITVNTSATTGQGIPQLLEMLALQAEVLELKANPYTRARGTVLESEMHKGFGATATILVQNGTLRQGDAIVLENHWGRIKTMRDEFGALLKEAPPATPVEITGLSGVPEAGDSFIVVSDEKEARHIAETRAMGTKARAMQQKKPASLESMLQEDAAKGKKNLKLIIRSDVQGSVEALKASLMKIESAKVDLEIIFAGVGEITESDVQLAAASHAVILGFHTQIESRASSLIKELGVTVKLHNIIYHAIDDIKVLMQGLLDKIAQEKETGHAEVRAVFKASQLGVIAGCQVIEGVIARSHYMRLEREGKIIWKGSISSLKRVKEDVREVKKGVECGILLNNYNDVRIGDILQAYEITYITQEI